MCRHKIINQASIIISIVITMALVGCGRQKTTITGADLLKTLDEGNYSLVVYNHDSVSTYTARGVQDLLYLTASEPERLQGAVVADKMIGKAAAALMVVGGVKEVYTHIICTPAREMFETAQIHVESETEVPMIMNRDKTAQCPIDSKINDAQTPEQCVEILRNLTF